MQNPKTKRKRKSEDMPIWALQRSQFGKRDQHDCHEEILHAVFAVRCSCHITFQSVFYQIHTFFVLPTALDLIRLNNRAMVEIQELPFHLTLYYCNIRTSELMQWEAFKQGYSLTMAISRVRLPISRSTWWSSRLSCSQDTAPPAAHLPPTDWAARALASLCRSRELLAA